MMQPKSIVAYLLAAFMIFMGVQKFLGDVPIFSIIESNLYLQFGLTLPFVDPWVKYLTGAVEILAAGLIIARRPFEGSALAVLIIIGAVFAHLTVLGVNTQMSNEVNAEESPMLFIMALAGLCLAIASALMNRDQFDMKSFGLS